MFPCAAAALTHRKNWPKEIPAINSEKQERYDLLIWAIINLGLSLHEPGMQPHLERTQLYRNQFLLCHGLVSFLVRFGLWPTSSGGEPPANDGRSPNPRPGSPAGTKIWLPPVP